MAKHINKADLEAMKDNGVTVIDFFADWCGPCKAFVPIVEKVSAEYEGRANVVMVNVDEEKELAMEYQVMSIPSVVYIKDGKKIAKKEGLQTEEELKKSIEELL